MMKKPLKGLVPRLYLITLLYFTLPFVSIQFANLALLCMMIPFILLAKTKQKVWCQHYCPRASLLKSVPNKNRNKKIPSIIANKKASTIMLWYFSLNLLFITGSTIQVARGSMASMEYVRLFIAIPLVSLPQLLPIESPAFLLHLSYRFYSMMASTTILALILAYRYRPRLWCAACPVGTMLDKLIANQK